MQTLDTAVSQELRKIIEERVAHLKNTLVTANFNFDQYRYSVGKIQALSEVDSMIDQAFAVIAKRNN